MSDHTPAPWHCSPVPGRHMLGIYAGDDDTVLICEVSDEDLEVEGQRDVNARLIAASPDLLAALEGVVDWRDNNPGDWSFPGDQIRDALAKAKGET